MVDIVRILGSMTCHLGNKHVFSINAVYYIMYTYNLKVYNNSSFIDSGVIKMIVHVIFIMGNNQWLIL